MSNPLQRWLREVKAAALVLLFVAIGETAIAQPFIVPSGSMEPTLLVGDELLASKYAYGYGRFSLPLGQLPDVAGRILGRPAARGDVVVFRLPRDPAQVYVKRVIGLPGDRIQMNAGELYINDRLVPRRAAGQFVTEHDGRSIAFRRYTETLPGGREHEILKSAGGGSLDDTPVFTVPPNSYFMMGDNRDNSLDSRIAAEAGGVGFVPEENLVGRADIVLFSINPFAQWRDIVARPAAFRISRILNRVG
jgi:signal peptidase I